jgi:hypothetical protein
MRRATPAERDRRFTGLVAGREFLLGRVLPARS